MKSRYIKFFKKELVFLLVLLIVVCISFGITYANFIYNSEGKRAVEMFTGALSYNMKINDEYRNNIDLLPGSQIINIDIESTNEISSYYKLLTNNNITIYSIEGNSSGIIGSSDTLSIKLYVINNTNENLNISFLVSMGYLTNTLDDVKVNEGYYEIENIKEEIVYDNKKWSIIRINDDASIDLISNDLYNVTLSGYDGYNNLNKLLDSKCINSRSITIDDIEDLTINPDNGYTKIDRLIYYPNTFKNDVNVIIDNSTNEGNGYSYTNSLLLRDKHINSSFNTKLFNTKKYLLSTPYYEIKNNEIYYYAIELSNGKVNLKKLYDSNNTNYEVTSNVRCITTIKDINF